MTNIVHLNRKHTSTNAYPHPLVRLLSPQFLFQAIWHRTATAAGPYKGYFALPQYSDKLLKARTIPFPQQVNSPFNPVCISVVTIKSIMYHLYLCFFYYTCIIVNKIFIIISYYYYFFQYRLPINCLITRFKSSLTSSRNTTVTRNRYRKIAIILSIFFMSVYSSPSSSSSSAFFI